MTALKARSKINRVDPRPAHAVVAFLLAAAEQEPLRCENCGRHRPWARGLCLPCLAASRSESDR